MIKLNIFISYLKQKLGALHLLKVNRTLSIYCALLVLLSAVSAQAAATCIPHIENIDFGEIDPAQQTDAKMSVLIELRCEAQDIGKTYALSFNSGSLQNSFGETINLEYTLNSDLMGGTQREAVIGVYSLDYTLRLDVLIPHTQLSRFTRVGPYEREVYLMIRPAL